MYTNNIQEDKNNQYQLQKEQRSQELKQGPLESRGCTDILCCLIFLGFWVGIGFIAWVGFKNGNPQRLATPFDGSGNQCGVKEGFEDYPKIYFVQPERNYLYRTVCVKECPNWSTNDTAPKALECKNNTVVDTCNQTNIYKTTTFADKICLPVDNDFYDIVLEVLSQAKIDEIMRDLWTSKYIILVGFFLCLALGFFWMFLIRICSGFIVWLIIVLYLATLGVLGYFFFSKFYNFKSPDEKDPGNSSETTYQWLFYITCGVFVLSIICIACCFNKIRLVTAILETASEFVTDVKSALTVPPVIWLFISLFFALWLTIALFLYSSGKQVTPEPQSMFPFGQMDMDTTTRWLFLVHLFGLFWGTAFLLSLSQFIIASAACFWYFSPRQGQLKSPVCRSVCRGLFNHSGSLAVGSFLLAVVWFVQSILAYMKKQLQINPAQDPSSVKKNCIKCLSCCLDCFERFIQFINKHAYIEIALTGDNFCKAAYKGFVLIASNAVRFGLVSGLGHILVFLGEVLICAISAACTYLIILIPFFGVKNQLYFLYSPVIFIGILGYSIGSIFMHVYGIAANAILHCFCLDEELHGKGQDQYGPQSLKKFIDTNCN